MARGAKNARQEDRFLNEIISLLVLNARKSKNALNAKIIEDKEFSPNGKSHVEFVITTNLGEEEKKLNKIASGGEMSRIMLAIKTVLSDIDEVPVLIFDEIDTGISGAIGKRVGEKMYQVSVKHQVLCITHLPQIAALSDNHYFVSKKVENGKTFTQIRMLNEQDKVCEIAKMIGGDNLSDVAIDNSREMVKLANIKKNEIKNEFI